MKSKFFKTICGKLSAVAIASSCLFGIFTAGNLSAEAKTEYPISVVNYDGVDYAGVRIDKNNIDTFRETIDMSSCDLDTPIFQFVITPSQRGDGKKYTPDFEKLTFTLSDSLNKAMSISFSPRHADSPRYNYLCAFAGGENQTLLGEHHNNLQYEVDSENPECVLSDTYSSISPYTFDGYGADFSYFQFYDKNGNKAQGGKNGVVSIYYDREENAIYADQGWKWVDDDPEKPHTLVDKYKIAPSGERRWRIRDLDKTDYVKGGNVVGSVWSGFGDLSAVTFKIDFSAKKNDNGSILLVSLGGQMLTGNYHVEYKNKGVVGKNIDVPKPKYFSNTVAYDYSALENSEYLIKDPDGNVVVEKKSYTSNEKFVPTKAGLYTVEYFAKDPNENVIKTHSLKITVLQTGGSTLNLKGIGRNYLLYDEIDAGYTLENNIQEELPDVYVTVKKDGDVVVAKTKCDPNYKYYFDSEGEYQFDYEVTDYLGQTVTKSFSCVVNNFTLKMTDGLSPTVLYTSMKDFELPTANDYSLINVKTGAKINPNKVDIKARLNDGEWVNLTAGLFTSEGIYDILYVYLYDGIEIVAQRQIFIYNNLPTISVEKVPSNTVLFEGESIDSDSIRVKALKGKQVGFSYGYFKSSQAVKVEKIVGSSVEDVTSLFKSGSYSVTFNEEGLYCISAYINVGDVYVVRKNIFIEVKSSWVELSTPNSQTFDVGREVAIEVPKAKDFYGNEITEGTFKVWLGDKEIAVTNGKFTPREIGVYNIVYTVVDQSISTSCEFVYYVTDTIAPVITVTGAKKNSTKGKEVDIGNVAVSDNAKLDAGYTVSVTYNGEVVALIGNKFIAENEGTYVVKIEAIDASGNMSQYVYEIQIGPKNYTWIILVSIGGGIVLAGGIVLLILLIKKKKDSKAKDSEEAEQDEKEDN